tara:strand:- start:959 stop:2275 length:1317 start_codon:yes stop_codon:yes gene_type:complete
MLEKIDENTCEYCLSQLTGILIPRPYNAQETNFGYTLRTPDAKILKSIAKQLSKKIALTDRQYELVKTKLLEYQDQFESNGVDIESCITNLAYPLREIDRSHTLKIIQGADEQLTLAMRFPFNKKILDRVEEIRRLEGKTKRTYKDSTHYFAFTPDNLVKLVQIAQRFEHKFEIDENIKEIYNTCLGFEEDKEQYVPGVYGYELKNIPDTATENLLDDIGEVNETSLSLYYDRKNLYGIHHFDKTALENSIGKLSSLSQTIVKRNMPTVLLPTKSFSFSQIVNSLFELKRFPVLVVLDGKEPLDQLTVAHYHFRNVIHRTEMSVCFRQQNTWIPEQDRKVTDPFNQYVTSQELNKPVDKNTKVVYINNNKLPKPLLKNGFIPKCVISFGGKGLSFNNVTQYIQQFDLQIVYEDESSSVYWNRTEKRLAKPNQVNIWYN